MKIHRCGHQHPAMAEAVRRLLFPGSFIRAVEDGIERSLSDDEMEMFHLCSRSSLGRL